MKNQFTVSINQLREGWLWLVLYLWKLVWLLGGSRAVATIRSATVTTLHGEAAVSALNDPGMSTAKRNGQYLPQFFDTYRKTDGSLSTVIPVSKYWYTT